MTDNEKVQLIQKIIGHAYRNLPADDGLAVHYEATLEAVLCVTVFRTEVSNDE